MGAIKGDMTFRIFTMADLESLLTAAKRHELRGT